MADSTVATSRKDSNLWNPDQKTLSTDKSNLFGLNAAAQYKTLQYPTELGTPRYPYSMLIFVNANSASALGKGTTGAVVQPLSQKAQSSTESRGVNQSISSTARTNQKTAGAAIGALAGVGALGVAAASVGIAAVGAAVGIGAGVAGALAGATTAAFTDFIPSYKRLNLVVGLPMPQQISFGHDAQYRNISSGFLGTMFHDITSEDMTQTGKDAARALTQGAISFGASTIADTVGMSGEDIVALSNKMQGVAKNERKEQIFEGMNIREFSFKWLFVPKTETESDSIKNIIQWLKYNQYPEVAAGNNLQVIIPNEFDIEFHYNGKEIDGMSKITTCVLAGVNVNYTPTNKFIAFAGTDNPVAIELELKFTELEPLVRSMIAKGY